VFGCSQRIFRLAIEERRTGKQKNMGAVVRKVTRDDAVRRLARKLVRLVPAIDVPEYRPLVLSYARLAILNEKAHAHLKEAGLIDDKGELRNSINTYRQLAGQLQSAARELGLTPTMAASLAKPVKYLDLESLRENEDEDEH
jgi:phage terminase small subunit